MASIISPKQYKFLQSMLTHTSIREAASAINLREATAYKWANDDKFKAALREARANQITQIGAAIGSLLDDAFATVKLLMNSPDTPDNVKLNAARFIIEHNTVLFESDVIEAQIEKLEAAEERLNENE